MKTKNKDRASTDAMARNHGDPPLCCAQPGYPTDAQATITSGHGGNINHVSGDCVESDGLRPCSSDDNYTRGRWYPTYGVQSWAYHRLNAGTTPGGGFTLPTSHGHQHGRGITPHEYLEYAYSARDRLRNWIIVGACVAGAIAAIVLGWV
jgi:hypothetical protein